jgi:hypothetical protein
MAIVPMRPMGLSRPPPKNSAKFASMDTAPARVAVIVIVSVSRFLICASSWATTPATSSRLMLSRSPRVTATAALSGLRPVANALGWSDSMMYSFGIGRPAFRDRSSVMR